MDVGENFGLEIMKVYFLKSERLGLRALRAEDATSPYADWLNDQDVCRGNNHHRWPYSSAEATDYISETKSKKNELVLAVEVLETGKHIGNIALQSINFIHRSAEISFLIGDTSVWGKGYGLEAGRILIKHAFDELNLRRVGCGTPSYNQGMIKLAQALGMTEEGRRRQAFFKHGEYHDIVEFGLLKTEFFQGWS